MDSWLCMLINEFLTTMALFFLTFSILKLSRKSAILRVLCCHSLSDTLEQWRSLLLEDSVNNLINPVSSHTACHLILALVLSFCRPSSVLSKSVIGDRWQSQQLKEKKKISKQNGKTLCLCTYHCFFFIQLHFQEEMDNKASLRHAPLSTYSRCDRNLAHRSHVTESHLCKGHDSNLSSNIFILAQVWIDCCQINVTAAAQG